MTVQRKVMRGFGAAVLLLALIAVLSYRHIRQSVATADRVTRTHQVVAGLEELSADVLQTETASRGYLITGQERYLEPYHVALQSIPQRIRALRELTADTPSQQLRLNELEQLVNDKVGFVRETIEVRRVVGFEAASKLVQSDRGRILMDDFQRVVAQMEKEERGRLAERNAAARVGASVATVLFLLGSLLSLALVALAGWVVHRNLAERERSREVLEQANEKLTSTVNELEKRTLEITRLSALSDLLQSCLSVAEAYKVIVRAVPQFFPSLSGALCMLSTSRNLVEIVATWGGPLPGERVFPPEECVALRRGRVHFLEDPDSGLRCQHLGEARPAGSLCVPMMAQGDALGVLHLQGGSLSAGGSGDPPRVTDATRRVAVTVAEQIALALANLNLRETLRSQSIRDSLTGLFNRRYLEESLDREVRRASRGKRPLSVIMLDLDLFKRFNDSFGHDAGDQLLRQFAGLLQTHVRAEDVACRYGGEEFALILPETPLRIARERAEKLREAAKGLVIQHRGQSLSSVSISLGVAVFPDHGTSPETILHAADQALYRAKAEGRDRVVIGQAAEKTSARPQPE